MIRRFFQWFRLLLGRCPNCNGDAPECYDCPVCEDHRNAYPSKELKAEWRRRMKELEADEDPAELQCPVCGYHCLGKGGHGCIDKPSMQRRG